jgi:hypothetical protein
MRLNSDGNADPIYGDIDSAHGDTGSAHGCASSIRSQCYGDHAIESQARYA